MFSSNTTTTTPYVEGLSKMLNDLDTETIQPLIKQSLAEKPLPCLVVIGKEKVGKSTLINRVMMRDVVPVGKDDTLSCTKLPLIISLRRSKETRIELGVVSNSEQESWKVNMNESDVVVTPVLHHDSAKLDDIVDYMTKLILKMRNQNIAAPSQNIIEAVQNLIGAFNNNDQSTIDSLIIGQDSTTGISKEIISYDKIIIRIWAPNVPNLNLIDVPGVISTDGERASGTANDIMQLVQGYVEKSTHVIRLEPFDFRINDSHTLDILKKAIETSTILILNKMLIK
jgi:GTPase SAR1 family protein